MAAAHPGTTGPPATIAEGAEDDASDSGEEGEVDAESEEDTSRRPPTGAPAAPDGTTKKKKKKKKSKKRGNRKASSSSLSVSAADLAVMRTYADGRAVTIEHDPIKGRLCRTTRALDAGELVFEDRGIFVLRRAEGPAKRGLFCDGCGQPFSALGITPAFRCATCPEQYCAPCRSRRQAVHDRWCPVLRRAPAIAMARSTDMDLVRMLAEVCAVSAQEGTGTTFYRALSSLVTHRALADPAWATAVEAAAADLLSACADARLPTVLSVSELVDMACRINNNAHGVADPAGSNRTIGLGVFPLCAILCHSCLPNCAHVAGGDGRLAIRAVRKIDPGEELLVSYVDLYQDRRQRRQQLYFTKRFWCACERCLWLCKPTLGPAAALPPRVEAELELDGLLCECGRGVYSLSRVDALSSPDATGADVEHAGSVEIACSETDSCSRRRTRDVVAAELERLEGIVGDALLNASLGQYGDVERTLRAFLDDARTALPARHTLVLSALTPLLNLAVRGSKFIEVAALCERVVACMDAVYPEFWAEKSDFLQQRAEALQAEAARVVAAIASTSLPAVSAQQRRLAKLHRAQAAAAATRCVAVRNVCYGPDHPATIIARRVLEECTDLS